MRSKIDALTAVAALAVGLAALAGTHTFAAEPGAGTASEAMAQMKDPDGKDVGTVSLRQTPYGTLLHVKLQGLPAGAHAFHVHETGACEAPSFKSAGGHFNPTDEEHGFLDDDGVHVGDMPNIHVPDSGTLEVEVFNSALNLDEALFDEDGSSIVIHQDADDYTTNPAGAAGPRIACGVIEKQKQM